MTRGLVGDPFVWVIITGTLGAVLWYHEHHWQRFTAWLFALTAGFLVVAVPALEDSLGTLLATGSGIVALLVLLMLFGISFYLGGVRSHRPSWLRKKLLTRTEQDPVTGRKTTKDLVPLVPSSSPRRAPKHHRVWTPVSGAITGGLFVVVIAGWRLVASAGARSLQGTGQAFRQAGQQINSGQAAHAVSASQAKTTLAIAIGALVLFALVLRRIEHKRGGGGTVVR